ncbi:MAG TPA: glycosyltransferase, partial [Flavobacteriaceae bacterium]|nr:glycosyltransferase [Flavobacteriaceae bacterium]
ILKKTKLLVAPLRYGAGLKGKIIQAFRNGTVVVTTAIGAEGIFSSTSIAGSDLDSFVKLVNELYNDEQQWIKCQRDAFEVLNVQFDSGNYSAQLFLKLATLFNDLPSHRQSNFVGLMLHYHSHQSSKYLSKWIEEKNKN